MKKKLRGKKPFRKNKVFALLGNFDGRWNPVDTKGNVALALIGFSDEDLVVAAGKQLEEEAPREYGVGVFLMDDFKSLAEYRPSLVALPTPKENPNEKKNEES